jgi:stearoyl-CoA desaturase (delta-9 desaturase)
MSDNALAKPSGWRSYLRVTTVLFSMVHVVAVVGAVVYWSWGGVALALASYFVRMAVVTLAYHRYFSHRAFKTSRLFQLILALGAESAGQKGVIWWASHHRWHHKHSDTPKDVHSAKLRGFWYSHVGWILSSTWTETDPALVGDLTKYPELRFLDRPSVELLPMVALALGFLFIGGGSALIWGFFVSSVLLYHGSFSVNSLAHLFGRRRYATTDESRNSFLLALATTGEGWHNNHHHYPSSARQGFRWWEIDTTYYLLRGLATVGLVWDLRQPSPEALAGPLAADEAVDEPVVPAAEALAVDALVPVDPAPSSGTLYGA